MTPSRILIVEDDRVVARDIQLQLTRIGHTVVAVTARGEEVLPLAIQTRPHLVLMDIKLEGPTDGIDAALQIRDVCKIPVVYLTAYADDQTLRRAGVTEPFGYLLKPFEDAQLRTAIEMALYKHTAERRLRESERRYAVTLASIGDAVIATDERLRVTFVNPVAESLTGWTSSEAVGLPLADVFHIMNEDSRQPVENPAANVLRSGVVMGLANHTVLLGRHGRAKPIEDCGSPIIDDNGEVTGTVLVFRDVTERRQADEALRRAEAELAHGAQRTRMGELAAAIAHEVTQPITALISNAGTSLRLLAVDSPDLDEVRLTARRMQRDAQRAADVIARLRVLFGRTSDTHSESIDLNKSIQEVVALTRNELQESGATVRLELSEDVPPLVADRVQLQQVVLNLITNAIESMSGVDGRQRELVVGTQRDNGAYVEVFVRDSGVGLQPTSREQMFNPFFTTKSDGMGIGLSICRSIVENHGGRLWAVPNDGPGTTFLFTLPLRA
jgi:PAS domain S-box-containing protein